MSMPAVQAYRACHPDEHLALLVKPRVRPLWEGHEAPDEILELGPGMRGLRQAVREVRRGTYQRAFVLPNSWRSALIPFLAGVPERVGARGHARGFLLSDVVSLPSTGHQSRETAALLMGNAAAPMDPPRIPVPDTAAETAATLLPAEGEPWLALAPGAARGPSKQWPADHFAAVGRKWRAEGPGRVAVLGSPAEAEQCAAVCAAAGEGAVSLAGRTSFAEWMAVLRRCAVVVCNDSGAMHVASALGTPVVVIFGITDPARTGPLGPSVRILQNSDVRARDIPRDSSVARKSLASIRPEQVYETAMACLSD
jgi:heptosyltransferase-2